jgi:hypothetical protein
MVREEGSEINVRKKMKGKTRGRRLQIKISEISNTSYKRLLTYLLTPWSTVRLKKLTVNFAASQEIPRIYGTRKFLTVPTSVRHLSLS